MTGTPDTPPVAVRRRRAPWLLRGAIVAPLALAGLVDVPRLASVSGATGLGALTVAECALAAVGLLVVGRFPKRLLRLLLPYALLVGWAAASALWAPPRTDGWQNGATYLQFGILALAAGVCAMASVSRAERDVERGMRLLDAGGLALATASLVLRGWPDDASPWLVHPRAFAIVGLSAMSWRLSRWYHGRPRDLVVALAWLAAIFASLSRTATAAAVLLLVIVVALRVRVPPSGAAPVARRHALALALVPIVIAAAALRLPAFRERLFARDERAVAAGELRLNDSARGQIWTVTIASARRAPWIGQGLGSSQAAVSRRLPLIAHPHNDFLRVWHDLGAAGLACLVVALGVWGAALVRAWRRGRSEGLQPAPRLELAALLALLGYVAAMVTDNPVVYPFVAGPVGVVVGAGLGAALRRRVRRAHTERGSGRTRRRRRARVR